MTLIQRALTAMLTGPALRGARRLPHRARRRLKASGMTASFFLQIDDPYAAMALRYLVPLADRHGVHLAIEPVSPPDSAAAPEPDRLMAYARRDATALARALGLSPPADHAPHADDRDRAMRIACAAIAGAATPAAIIDILEALQAPQASERLASLASAFGEADSDTTGAMIARGNAQRERFGHYLGSTTHFEGDFYWGVDRLHFLEARLRQETGIGGALICPVLDPVLDPLLTPGTPALGSAAPRIDFYLSFRSPYTLVAAERIGALAAAYGANLRLRPVLPMVMRGLPVPRAKRMYITLDTKREAERHGIRFGTIVDPVGTGVERGLAVLHHAIAQGKGLAFAQSFLRGAFADGIDMTSDAGLMKVADRAGISAATASAALADDGWRAVAEANRTYLFALGLWGVPSFQVDDRPGWWGQDRLWCVEDDLRAALGLPPIDRKMA